MYVMKHTLIELAHQRMNSSNVINFNNYNNNNNNNNGIESLLTKPYKLTHTLLADELLGFCFVSFLFLFTSFYRLVDFGVSYEQQQQQRQHNKSFDAK